MKLPKTTNCPRCSSPTIHWVPKPKVFHCKDCDHLFPETNNPLGTRVRIRQPNSCWNNLVGDISALLPNDFVKVRFIINKEVFGDIFHPAYLEKA